MIQYCHTRSSRNSVELSWFGRLCPESDKREVRQSSQLIDTVDELSYAELYDKVDKVSYLKTDKVLDKMW